MLHKIKFYSSVGIIYFLTVGTIWIMFDVFHTFKISVGTERSIAAIHTVAAKPVSQIITGKPERIAIASRNIDLPVDDGHYDPATGAWTLSPDHAQFATISAPANDHAGTTFLYGHGTDAVFGKIGTDYPHLGTTARLYTKNDRVFTYKLIGVKSLTPDDTSVLKNMSSGPPRLIIQTCTGLFSEWRTMFIFSYEGVS